MSTKNSALASLTETYTDSENEDDHSSNDDESQNTEDGSSESQSLTFRPPSKSTTPTKPHPDNNIQPSTILTSTTNTGMTTTTNSARPLFKSSLRLVSYNDDAAISDEENLSPNRDNVNMDISEEEGDQQSATLTNNENQSADTINKEQTERQQIAIMKKDKITEYGFNLPAEPKGKCPQELQDKITNMYEKMKNGMDMNKVIQERKEFRNPSIYEKLIQFCDINELGTNYPNELYDPLQWGKESFYEELARVQKVEMERREKERKESLKLDAVMVAAKKAEEESKKRYLY